FLGNTRNGDRTILLIHSLFQMRPYVELTCPSEGPMYAHVVRIAGRGNKRPGITLQMSSMSGSRCVSTYWGQMMDINESQPKGDEMLIELTADVVSAYVSNNPVPAGELPNLIADVHAALGRVGGAPEQAPADKQKPAVNPKRSVHDDYIVCRSEARRVGQEGRCRV